MASFGIAGTNAAEGVNSTAHSFILGGGLVTGRRMVITASVASVSTVVTLTGLGVSGKAPDDSNPQGTGHNLHVWVLPIDAARDTDSTVTITTSASLKIAVAYASYNFTDVDPAVAPQFIHTGGISSTTLTGPTFTPDPYKVAILAAGSSSGAGAPATVWTAPPTVTLRANRATGGTTGRTAAVLGDTLTPNAALGTAWATDTPGAWSVTAIVFGLLKPDSAVAVAAVDNGSETVSENQHLVLLRATQDRNPDTLAPTGATLGIQNNDTLVVAAQLASGTTLTLNGVGKRGVLADEITSRSGSSLHVWVLPLLATDDGTELEFVSGTVLKVAIVGRIYRGPIDLGTAARSVMFSELNGTTSTTVTAPTTTPSANTIVLHAVGSSSGSTEPATTWTPPTGVTLARSARTGGPTGRSAVALGENLTKGATVGTGWTTDTAGAWTSIAITLSLAPVTATPPTVNLGTPATMKIDGAWVKGYIRGIVQDGQLVTGTVVGYGAQAPAPEPDPIDPGTPPPPITGTGFTSEGLWFDARPIQAPMSKTKLVVAHYFPPYPIKISNKPVPDEYNTAYLNPDATAYVPVGGMARNRPLDRDVYTDLSVTSKVAWGRDMESEIGFAKAAGIDAFVVDILGATGRNHDLEIELINAADRLNNGFRVIPMLDANGNTALAGATEAADQIAKYAGKRGSYYLPDGRFLVTVFRTEGQTLAFYQSMLGTLKNTYKLDVALIGIMNEFNQTTINTYKSILYGAGAWGLGGDPAAIKAASNMSALAHTNDLIYMGPVSGQAVRHTQSGYDEGANSEGPRASWEKVIRDDYDIVQHVTWNDISEGAEVMPSARKGYCLLDLGAWYTHRFKTGVYPEIRKDVAFLVHRAQFVGVNTTSEVSGVQTKFTVQRPRPTRTAPRDMVEVLTFLTASASVTVKVGANTYTYTAPAGMSAKLYPLAVAGTGGITVQAVRGGTTVIDHATHSHVSAMPVIEDKTYDWSSSERGIGAGIRKQADVTVNRTAP